MYHAYDRYLNKRPADASASATTSRLAPEHVDPGLVVHPLLFCPPLPRGTRFVLVKREWSGGKDVLGAGRTWSAHATENLARVRLSAAQLGANEVHVLPAIPMPKIRS